MAGPIDSRGGSRRPDLARRRGEELIVGRLVSHGRAHYQFRVEEDPSYYVKLLTSKGPRVLWGNDLERALRDAETRPQAGDLIGARRQAREAVTVRQSTRDEQGNVIATNERFAHRSLWVVEKVSYFAERARIARQVREDHVDARQAVRKHPELLSTFLSIRAAEVYAKHAISNPEDREKFLYMIRAVLGGSVENGTPIPNVRLRDPIKPQRAEKPPKNRDEPTR